MTEPTQEDRLARIERLTDDELLDEIEATKKRLDADRAYILALIPRAFPQTRGEPEVRGRLAAVVKRTGWTREHVANIRDGKVTE
jgi:hypothetical protein